MPFQCCKPVFCLFFALSSSGLVPAFNCLPTRVIIKLLPQLFFVCRLFYIFPQFYKLKWLVGWLCWGLTSQSTIFQSCRDGAIASWVINQYFRGVKCLAQGHNTAAVGLEPRTSRSGVRHSTTEPPRSPETQMVAAIFFTVFLSIHTATLSLEDYEQAYIVHTGFAGWKPTSNHVNYCRVR